jgi:hypothetical protein
MDCFTIYFLQQIKKNVNIPSQTFTPERKQNDQKLFNKTLCCSSFEPFFVTYIIMLMLNIILVFALQYKHSRHRGTCSQPGNSEKHGEYKDDIREWILFCECPPCPDTEEPFLEPPISSRTFPSILVSQIPSFLSHERYLLIRCLQQNAPLIVL